MSDVRFCTLMITFSGSAGRFDQLHKRRQILYLAYRMVRDGEPCGLLCHVLVALQS